MYEGTRVKTWILGRDVNPGGRGDGAMYAHGAFKSGLLRPVPSSTAIGGFGNSVNNQDMGPGGGGSGDCPGCHAPCVEGGCGPGFVGSPHSCCCEDTDDPLRKCIAKCGACCCISKYGPGMGMCPPMGAPPRGLTHEQALRDDPGYAGEWCSFLRCRVEDMRKNARDCSEDAGWQCCKEFCMVHDGFGGGDAAGFGGGGCAGCGGNGKGIKGSGWGSPKSPIGNNPCDRWWPLIQQNPAQWDAMCKNYPGNAPKSVPDHGCGANSGFVLDSLRIARNAVQLCCFPEWQMQDCINEKLGLTKSRIKIKCASDPCECWYCERGPGGQGRAAYTRGDWDYIVLCDAWNPTKCTVAQNIAHEAGHHCGFEHWTSLRTSTDLENCVMKYCTDITMAGGNP